MTSFSIAHNYLYIIKLQSFLKDDIFFLPCKTTIPHVKNTPLPNQNLNMDAASATP